MSTSAIGTTTAQGLAANAAQATTRATGTRDLGQDAFMRLLTTQLQNQDPTKPQDNGEFIAQLATFSQLEKLTIISDKLDQIGTALGVTLTDTGASGTSGTSGATTPSSTGTTGTSTTKDGGK
ncbi:hypothetical protein TBR22_A27650 [Luteitalea sp. TBR-22]|uniref:flagellar hook capping FlgD N-terminal domain-containing protein n=1 Tax=Luteitalea sp. TBR-22 TaxID=2802971 RepID=UPI001AF2E5C4|nr:flagellar hook capping FlgD N-terminal domain-containing protein [Luteitalea sp. TBR-22]BCS33538.1 hypothetical protein TBR22_A27650 [Luteitalea sp. TBR-22]